jgi:hypothetical protein
MNDGLLAHRTLLRLSPLAPQRMRDAHVLWSGLEYVAGLSHYTINKHQSTSSSTSYDDIINDTARISCS